MGKFRYRLFQFMQGRRGMDQLGSFLFTISSLLLLITAFTLSSVTYYPGILLWIYAMYRALSRNLYKREQENNRYLALKFKVTGGRSFGGRSRGGQRARWDMQNYVYFKCPGCGQKMRAPRGRGKIRIRCHNCQREFEKKV